MKTNPTSAPEAVCALRAIGKAFGARSHRWHFPVMMGILLLLGIGNAGLALAAPAAEAGLRLNRVESKAKGSSDLAQKAGGPTERIEIQSTDDHIDYVVKTYALKQANASEVYELIKAAIALEGGKVDRVSPGSVVDINMDGLESKHTYSGGSLLVVTVPEWMIPYLDRTIEMLDRPSLESASFGTGVAYMPVAADEPFLTHFPLAWERAKGSAYDIAFNPLRDLPEDQKAKAWRALGHIDTLSHAHRLTMPVLLTSGTADGVCPEYTIQTLFEKLPSTRSYTSMAGMPHGYTLPFLHLARAWFRLYV